MQGPRSCAPTPDAVAVGDAHLDDLSTGRLRAGDELLDVGSGSRLSRRPMIGIVGLSEDGVAGQQPGTVRRPRGS